MAIKHRIVIIWEWKKWDYNNLIKIIPLNPNNISKLYYIKYNNWKAKLINSNKLKLFYCFFFFFNYVWVFKILGDYILSMNVNIIPFLYF